MDYEINLEGIPKEELQQQITNLNNKIAAEKTRIAPKLEGI